MSSIKKLSIVAGDQFYITVTFCYQLRGSVFFSNQLNKIMFI
jgi:hypothetical protein